MKHKCVKNIYIYMKTRKKFSLSIIIEIDINIFVRKVKKHKERRYIVSFVNFKEKLIVRFNMNHRKSSRLSCILFFFFFNLSETILIV